MSSLQLSHQGSTLSDEGQPWWPHFNMSDDVRTLFPNEVTFWSCEGLQYIVLGRAHISTHHRTTYLFFFFCCYLNFRAFLVLYNIGQVCCKCYFQIGTCVLVSLWNIMTVEISDLWSNLLFFSKTPVCSVHFLTFSSGSHFLLMSVFELLGMYFNVHTKCRVFSYILSSRHANRPNISFN